MPTSDPYGNDPAELRRQRDALASEAYEVGQILGKAMGFPEGYPAVNPVDDGSVVTGEHTVVSLAMAAADRIAKAVKAMESFDPDVYAWADSTLEPLPGGTR